MASEKSRASAFEIEMKTLKGAYQRRLNEASMRIQELDSHNKSLSDDLEKQTEKTKQVCGALDYLVSEVAPDLNQSLTEYNLICKDET